MYIIELEPRPAPRMTKRDKWAKRKVVTDCFEWRKSFVLLCKQAQYHTLKPQLYGLFIIPMPISWSKKKRLTMIDKPHQQRPDTDNIIKNIQDSWGVDDGYVYSVHCEKYWGEKGRIILFETIYEMLNYIDGNSK